MLGSELTGTSGGLNLASSIRADASAFVADEESHSPAEARAAACAARPLTLSGPERRLRPADSQDRYLGAAPCEGCCIMPGPIGACWPPCW
jgi:hypothetical protein